MHTRSRHVSARPPLRALYLSLVLISLLAASAPAARGAGDADFVGCGGARIPAQDAAAEAQVIALLNQVRANPAAYGHPEFPPVPPLKHNPLLSEAARYHTADMVHDDYFEHPSYDRQGDALVQICEMHERIKGYYPEADSVGENLVSGPSTAEDAVALWLESAPHRSNMLRSSVREVGAGVFQGEFGGRLWALNLARDDGMFPLIINGEATATTAREVSLYLYGSWQSVRLRVNDGPWGAVQPFTNILQISLGDKLGLQTVYAEANDGTRTVIISDTITLSASVTTVYLPRVVRR